MRRAKRLITVRISRRRWFYGQNPDVDSCLRITPDQFCTGHADERRMLGKQCCLGFAARACEVSLKAIKGVAGPEDVARTGLPASSPFQRFVKRGPWGGLMNRVETTQMMTVNDKPLDELPRPEKERQLTVLARRLGFRFVFVP